MEKKWWVIIGIIILVILGYLWVQQKDPNLGPASVLSSRGDGCSLIGEIPITENMKKGCMDICNEKFPKDPENTNCKAAVDNLINIPATCEPDETCNVDGLSNDEIYGNCKIREREGVFDIDMDCELCYSFLTMCWCKESAKKVNYAS